MRLYHYADKPFDSIDFSKCDGFWMTDIEPSNEDMLDEIGAAGLRYVAIIDFDDSGDSIRNSDYNHDVSEQLEKEGADFIENIYDGFSDYATCNADLIKIIEWVEL